MRVRIGLHLTAIFGLLYSAFGLFESLTKFAVGIVVVCLSIIACGLLDTFEDQRLADDREKVWQRRDAQ